MTHRTSNVQAIASAATLTVLADLCFTTPAVVVQSVSSYLLMRQLGLGPDLHAAWLQATIGLYVLTGVCWLPLVWLQWRACHLAQAAVQTSTALPPAYHRYMKIWFVLGWRLSRRARDLLADGGQATAMALKRKDVDLFYSLLVNASAEH